MVEKEVAVDSQELKLDTKSLPLDGIFVSWAKLRRADDIAERLGLSSCTVQYFRRGTPLLLTVWKYFLQTARTLLLLLLRRPRIVVVTCPPIFAVFPVYLYAKIFRARYVIDFHSGCFLERQWQRLEGLQRFFAKRAVMNLVHNDDNAKRIAAWKVPYRVFPSLPPDLAQDSVQQPVAEPTAGERPRVVYICSFKSDEPVDVFLETAGRVPGADFLITGRAPEAVSKNLPDNVRLTGFLGEKEYTECLLQAQLIIALTTRAGTLLYGAQEAIALGKPLVLSRTPTLEAYFTGGRVMVENTAESLRCGILDALERGDDLRREMETFRTTCRRRGEARLEELRANLQKFESGVLHAGRKD